MVLVTSYVSKISNDVGFFETRLITMNITSAFTYQDDISAQEWKKCQLVQNIQVRT